MVLVTSGIGVGTAAADVEIGRVVPPKSEAALVRFELLAESARTHVSSAWVSHPEGAVVLQEGNAVTRGASSRILLGSSRVFVGFELGVSSVISAPSFRDGSSYRRINETPPTALASHGYSVTVAAPLGVQGRAGRVLAGFEALVGWRYMELNSPGYAANVDGFVPLFEARARAGVWLTPRISLSAIAGLGVVVNESRSLCLVLSVSRTPWDGALE